MPRLNTRAAVMVATLVAAAPASASWHAAGGTITFDTDNSTSDVTVSAHSSIRAQVWGATPTGSGMAIRNAYMDRRLKLTYLGRSEAVTSPAAVVHSSPGWIQAGGNVYFDAGTPGYWKRRYASKALHNRAMPGLASIRLRDAFIAKSIYELNHMRPWPDDFFPIRFTYAGHRYTGYALWIAGATVAVDEIRRTATGHRTKWRARVMVHFVKALPKDPAVQGSGRGPARARR